VELEGSAAVVTGGASGLGRATAARLAERGANVVIVDLAESAGVSVACELGDRVTFTAADVTDATALESALVLAEASGPLRVLVHCAGRGGPIRLVEPDGSAGSLERYESIVRTNLVGTFNALRLTAARMALNEPTADGRGVCVLTASVAAWEGQIGQIAYASSKAGVVGMTIVAARDLASKRIRVCTIAPGLFDTPLLARLPDAVQASLAASVPNPRRLGTPDEYALLALAIIENAMLNGETIRLDGALRMAPR